jgi:hypothetical protein
MQQQADLFANDFADVQSLCLNSQLFTANDAQVSGSKAPPLSHPFAGRPLSDWQSITDTLVGNHPLSSTDILMSVQRAWRSLWTSSLTNATSSLPLDQLNLPASAIGTLFEKYLALELNDMFPGMWRTGVGSEKDLVYSADDRFSVELKTSGQLGYRIFGNRSFNQDTGTLGKKDKSGYYIAINFHQHGLTLIRFGWLDASDWQGQKAASGQAAILGDDAYRHKLVAVPGDYILEGPLQLVDGIGESSAVELFDLGIISIRDLIAATGLPRHLRKLQNIAMRHSSRPELRPWATTLH